MRQVAEQIRQATAKRIAEEEFSKPNNQLDDLLPVLRTTEANDTFAQTIVNRGLVPGIGLFMAQRERDAPPDYRNALCHESRSSVAEEVGR